MENHFERAMSPYLLSESARSDHLMQIHALKYYELCDVCIWDRTKAIFQKLLFYSPVKKSFSVKNYYEKEGFHCWAMIDRVELIFQKWERTGTGVECANGWSFITNTRRGD